MDPELLKRYQSVTGRSKPQLQSPSTSEEHSSKPLNSTINFTPSPLNIHSNQTSKANKVNQLRSKYNQILNRKTISPIEEERRSQISSSHLTSVTQTQTSKNLPVPENRNSGNSNSLNLDSNPYAASNKSSKNSSPARRAISSASSVTSNFSALKEKYKKQKVLEKSRNELENSYHKLLQDYAAAKNTIDELRHGVNVNLEATLPVYPNFHHEQSLRQQQNPQNNSNNYEMVTSTDLTTTEASDVSDEFDNTFETSQDTFRENQELNQQNQNPIQHSNLNQSTGMNTTQQMQDITLPLDLSFPETEKRERENQLNQRKTEATTQFNHMKIKVSELEEEIDMFLEDNCFEIDADGINFAVGEIEKDYMNHKDKFGEYFDGNHDLMTDIGVCSVF